jgi:hypothetical protein
VTIDAPPTLNRAVVALPATMLLDLLKQAAAICGRPFPADMRFVTVEYHILTQELRFVVESEQFPRIAIGDFPMVIFNPFDGTWRGSW